MTAGQIKQADRELARMKAALQVIVAPETAARTNKVAATTDARAP